MLERAGTRSDRAPIASEPFVDILGFAEARALLRAKPPEVLLECRGALPMIARSNEREVHAVEE